jgi:hypothetical protein
MSPDLVSILAQITSEQARIAAMQVANAQIDLIASPPKYSEADFFAAAYILSGLSVDAKNLLT